MILEGNNTAFWANWTNEPVAVINNCVLSRQDFLQQAITLSKQLPDHQYAINLCKHRHHFALSFLAVLLKNQTSILPSNNAPQSIRELIGKYADSYLLSDEKNTRNYSRYHEVSLQSVVEEFPREVIAKLSINADHLAVIAFTSGSTGKAKANHKYWWQLIEATQQALSRFQISRKQPQAIISTVPSQHMYGLESSILYTLLGKSVLISGDTFFPDDIRKTLKNTTYPAIFITTPVHLRMCIQSGLNCPSIKMIISATAPLDKTLAGQAERLFNCPVMEIFGSTETGSIASRRTVHSNDWHLYDQVRIKHNRDGLTAVKGPQHDGWITLSDHTRIVDEEHFELLGRHTDMVKIAGKRASIADLSIKLNSIKGVIDGVIFQQDDDPGRVNRLIAFVIAPDLSIKQINHALIDMIDPAFLPRPIIKVDHLPRNETGKLSNTNLQKLYSEHSKRA